MKTFILMLVPALTMAAASPAIAGSVELMLSDRLDGNLDNYCLDISGSKQNADVSRGLQTHTCYAYQGAVGVDQVFDSEKFSQNQLYMFEFDVCATVSSLEAGTSIDLSACDNSDYQNITLTDEGHLSPVSATQLCFTAGEETKLGRGGTSQHQIKSLTLETCSDDLAKYQQWEPRAAR